MLYQGISTYDFIVAMREEDQKGIGDSGHNPTSPPGAAGTGICAESHFLAYKDKHGVRPRDSSLIVR